jgi:hypothetical protein
VRRFISFCCSCRAIIFIIDYSLRGFANALFGVAVAIERVGGVAIFFLFYSDYFILCFCCIAFLMCVVLRTILLARALRGQICARGVRRERAISGEF